MKRIAIVTAAFAVMLAVTAPRPVLPAPPTEAQLEAPALDHYDAALRALKAPPLVSFTYSIEQAGMRNVAQSHLVYREGILERDELLSDEGQKRSRPLVRIFHDRPDHYDILTLAPTRSRYTFDLTGTRHNGKFADYYYKTALKVPGAAFSVTSVIIEEPYFLPRVIEFETHDQSTRGSGRIEYAKAGHYWMPLSAAASASMGPVKTRERIVFADYRFPDELPASTFSLHGPPIEAPLSARSPLPIVRSPLPVVRSPLPGAVRRAGAGATRTSAPSPLLSAEPLEIDTPEPLPRKPLATAPPVPPHARKHSASRSPAPAESLPPPSPGALPFAPCDQPFPAASSSPGTPPPAGP